jgi:cytochrome d ubiquinol oxidase subunit II
MDLNTTWFFLIAVLFAGYAILDGFDLGVGILHLFSKNEIEKRTNVAAIGPVWDGNEVWLLTAGGALFAAFPIVYAQVFSAFYLALMLLLLALIARAVSFEFRSQVDSPGWRKVWDLSFGLGSFVPALLYSVAVGNILRGVPIEADGSLHISFFALLNPYSIVVGLTGVAMFIMQGAGYMTMKTDGEHREKMVVASNRAWMAFVVLFLIATIYTYFEANYLFEGVLSNPLFWVFFLLMLAAIGYFPVASKKGKNMQAFLASSAIILSVVGLSGVSLFPKMVPSSIDLAYSLTCYNASSTPLTLKTMLIIALLGMPIVIGYTIFIYRVFKGKVVLDKGHY